MHYIGARGLTPLVLRAGGLGQMTDADAAADERQLEEQARGHFERGDLGSARRLLEQAAELDDVHPSVLHNLGMVNLSLEDFDAAIRAYTRSRPIRTTWTH